MPSNGAQSGLPDSAMLTVKQVAEYLVAHESTVRKMITSGLLNAVRLGDTQNSHLRIPRDELVRFLNGKKKTEE